MVRRLNSGATATVTDAPHWLQKRAVSGFSWEQLAQRIGVPIVSHFLVAGTSTDQQSFWMFDEYAPLGQAGEIFVLTSVCMMMPVGRLGLSHALTGDITAALLRDVMRHLLVWYFGTLSHAGLVSEYERIGTAKQDAPAEPMRTD